MSWLSVRWIMFVWYENYKFWHEFLQFKDRYFHSSLFVYSKQNVFFRKQEILISTFSVNFTKKYEVLLTIRMFENFGFACLFCHFSMQPHLYFLKIRFFSVYFHVYHKAVPFSLFPHLSCSNSFCCLHFISIV